MVTAYEENLVRLIKDVRREWKTPNLPVVIAVSGFGGRNQKIDRRLGIIAAQHGAAARKEFKGPPPVSRPAISSGHVNNHPAVRAITGTTTPKPTTSSARAWAKRW